MERVHVGVSGWSYDGWKGRFYPKDLPARRRLEYASRQLDSIEINGSFYSLQRPSSYRRWYEESPEGFVFAVKGSRFITHNKKLGDAGPALANFFASGVLRLEEKLGPILWQLSRALRFDEARLRGFLDRLPRDTDEAAELAREYDRRLKEPAWTTTERRRTVRHALEPRHESWFVADVVRRLRERGVALVASDSADWRRVEDVTAGFVYVRLHGSARTYASRYSDAELDDWATRVRRWAHGSEPPDARKIADRKPARRKRRDVYVYFDNDQKAYAPGDALRLMERLGRSPE